MTDTDHAQIRSAESLLDAAAELIMDAASLLKDAADFPTIQRIEEYAVSLSREVADLQAQRGAKDEAAA